MSVFARLVQVTTAAAVLAGVLFWAASYASAAANTVPDTKAGDGAGTISGYTVSNVVYTLNGADPQDIDQVEFDLDVAPSGSATMQIRLVSGGSDWYTCTNVATALTCVTTAPQATVVSADELRVVVAD